MSFIQKAFTIYGDKLLNGIGRSHWLGDGKMLRGSMGKSIDKTPVLGFWNNALNAAPAWKWMLSIVPILEFFQGVPVDKLDYNMTVVLACTGYLFGTYALFVSPRAWLLFSCNAAMATVHTTNAYRIRQYHNSLKHD